jgi:hypothetical protein
MNKMDKKTSPAKIVVLGEGNFNYSLMGTFFNEKYVARVGKTSLTYRFCKNHFSEK